MPALVLYEWLRGPRIAGRIGPYRSHYSHRRRRFRSTKKTPSPAPDLYRTVSRARTREVDLAIAACVLVRGARLWTLNHDDFQDVPGHSILWAIRPNNHVNALSKSPPTPKTRQIQLFLVQCKRHEPRTGGPASQGLHRHRLPGAEQCKRSQEFHPRPGREGHRGTEILPQSPRAQPGRRQEPHHRRDRLQHGEPVLLRYLQDHRVRRACRRLRSGDGQHRLPLRTTGHQHPPDDRPARGGPGRRSSRKWRRS